MLLLKLTLVKVAVALLAVLMTDPAPVAVFPENDAELAVKVTVDTA